MKAAFQALACLPVCLAVCLVWQAHAQETAKPLGNTTQILVVITPDWNAIDGVMQWYERSGPEERWKSAGKPVAIAVGKTGLAWGIGLKLSDKALVRLPADPVKKEGDGKSPAGVFRLGTSFGYAAQPLPAWKMPYLALTPSVECVDDPASKFYNRLVDRAGVAPDWNSSEHMRDTGEFYRWGLVIEHNENPARPGSGSCIFMHIWGGHGHGTVGCTAMDRLDLETVLAWLDPKKHPLLVQLPAAEYEKLRSKLELPEAPRQIPEGMGSR